MATTPNYGWVTPDNTSFVKDGAQSIRNVSNSIDATSAGANFAGLVLIKTQTIGTAASVIVTSTFSATYDNYVLVINPSAASVNHEIRFRLSVGATPNAANSYAQYYVGITSGGTGVNLFGLSTSIKLCNNETGTGTNFNSAYLQINKPFLTRFTTMHNSLVASDGSNLFSQVGGASHSVATSFDAINLFTTTGTFSGEIAVYGYRKAI